MAKVIRLTENQFGEMMAYHGSGNDFDKFNHKKYLSSGMGSQAFGWGTYVTGDIAVANGYVKASLKPRDIDFLINFDVKGYLESKNKYSSEKIEKATRYFNAYVIALAKKSTYRCIKDFIRVLEFTRKKAEMPKKSDCIYKSERYDIKKLDFCIWLLRDIEKLAANSTKPQNAYFYEVEIPDDNGNNYFDWNAEISDDLESFILNKLKVIEKKFNSTVSSDYLTKYIDEVKYGCDLYMKLSYILKSKKAASMLLMYCGFDGIKYKAGTRWGKPAESSNDAMNYVIFDANKVKIINKTKV